MLKTMRKNAGSWIIKIVFSIIVIVFVFWGVGSFQENRENRVALVNGEPISYQSYQTTYQNYLENLQQQYGNNLNQDMIQMLQVPRRAIESLVTRQLLLQEAEKLNIRVTDAELASAIQSMSAFQEAGVFNNQRYSYILDQYRLTPEQFEASQRETMILEKLDAFIISGIKVTDEEIHEWYEWQNAAVEIDYVLFDPEDVEDLDPDEEALQTYFEANKEAYKTEPTVKVRYLAFRPEQYEDQAEITDEGVETYYDGNISEFEKEKTVEARHILVKVDENAAAEIVEEKRQQIEDVLNMAREGRDFAELAKEFSEGPTGENGGLLGEFKKDDMVDPFGEAAFSLAVDEISEPVRTQFGWHLIKVEKINEASVASLEDSAESIREKLIEEESKNIAFDQADDAFDKALRDEDFEKTAMDLGMELVSTEHFTSTGPDSGFAEPATLAQAAFQLENEDISDILTIDDNYYIIQKIEEKPAFIPEMADVMDAVKADLIKKMQDEQAAKRAEECLEALKAGNNMTEVAEEFEVEMRSTGFFKRSESIPDIGYEAEIIQTAFSLSDNNKISDTVLKGNQGYYTIQWKARQSPDPAELDTQKDTLKQQLISQKQQTLLENWLGEVQAASEIIIEDGYLN